MQGWDHEVDLLVVGSGTGMAAALTGAVRGLRTLVVEKASVYGGTTAISGGGIWVPNNVALERAGVADSPEAARAYLDAVLGLNDDDVSPERREAYLTRGPEALRFLEEHASHLRFTWVEDYPDYHPELPGGMAEGRQVQASAIDGRVLGDERANMRPPLRLAPQPFGMWIMISEARGLATLGRSWAGRLLAVKLALRGLAAKVRGKQMVNGGGQMLIAALRAALLEHDVPVWLRSPLVELVEEGGEVVGAVIDREGTLTRVRATAGVVIASGGFERNQAMRDEHQRQPITTSWTMGVAENTGDGIEAGRSVGAALDLMDEAWWGPSLLTPDGSGAFTLSERASPRSMLVNGNGERYTNEAAPYVNVCHAMYEGEATGVQHIPSWFVIDDVYRRRYKLGPFLPRQPIPSRWFESGVAVKAGTIAELADKIGVPADRLEASVARMNELARLGKDLDFGRGDSAYDRYWADQKNRPNPNLGPIDTAPFYAFKMVPGDLGTKGGLLTDERARVLSEQGEPIPGLYAAGNAAASVMGREYPGGGSTIGPGLTFGYIAAVDASERLRADRSTLQEETA